MTKEIALVNGGVALVDDEDFERLSVVLWHRSFGYAAGYLDGKNVSMHAAILDCPPGYERHHINHDRLDNRRANLRIVTPSENQRQRAKRSGTSSRFLGVCRMRYSRKKWKASIYVNGKTVHLGVFDDEEQAARRYDQAQREHFGADAITNFEA